MVNFIATLIILVIVGAAVIYIRKEKKKGIRCIGCPSAGSCSRSKACGGMTPMDQENKR